MFLEMTMKYQLTAPTHPADRGDTEAQGGRQNRPTVQPTMDRVMPLKLLRFPAVRERTGLSRSTIWRLERRGAFPKHRRISANTVAWVEEEVNIWIRGRVGD